MKFNLNRTLILKKKLNIEFEKRTSKKLYILNSQKIKNKLDLFSHYDKCMSDNTFNSSLCKDLNLEENNEESSKKKHNFDHILTRLKENTLNKKSYKKLCSDKEIIRVKDDKVHYPKYEKERKIKISIKKKELFDSFGKDLINGISYSMKIKQEMIDCLKDNEERCQKSNSKIHIIPQNLNLKNVETEELFNIDNKLKLDTKQSNKVPLKTDILIDSKNINISNITHLKSRNLIDSKNLISKSSFLSKILLSLSKENLSSDKLLNDCFILENTKFKIIWDFIIIIMIFYTITITPFYLCFYSSYSVLRNLEVFNEILFIIDFIFNFLTTYRDQEENLVVDLFKISTNYLFSWFFYDILHVFPLEIINIISNYSTTDFSRNIYVFLLNWIKMLRFQKLFRRNSVGKLINSYLFNRKYSLNRILKFAFIFVVLCHFSSCLFISIGNLQSFDNNWIKTSGLNDNDFFELYLASVYFIMVTVFSIGYGDITPTNIYERLCIIFIMFFGSMLYSYGISSLSIIFQEKNKKWVDYQTKVKILGDIQEENYLPDSLLKKLKKTLKLEYYNNEFEKCRLLDSLPTNLKNDLMKIIYTKELQKLNFFKNKSSDFILNVLPLLKHHTTYKGEVLFSIGDYVDEMYFIKKGCLSINLGSHYHNIEVSRITENQHFGEILLQMNEQSPYEIKCKSKYTEMFVLKKNDFLKLKDEYREILFDFLEESLQEYKKIEDKKDIFIELFNYLKTSEKVIKCYKGFKIQFLEYYFNEIFYFNIDDKSIKDYMINLYNDKEVKDYKTSLKGIKKSNELQSNFLENNYRVKIRKRNDIKNSGKSSNLDIDEIIKKESDNIIELKNIDNYERNSFSQDLYLNKSCVINQKLENIKSCSLNDNFKNSCPKIENVKRNTEFVQNYRKYYNVLNRKVINSPNKFRNEIEDNFNKKLSDNLMSSKISRFTNPVKKRNNKLSFQRRVLHKSIKKNYNKKSTYKDLFVENKNSFYIDQSDRNMKNIKDNSIRACTMPNFLNLQSQSVNYNTLIMNKNLTIENEYRNKAKSKLEKNYISDHISLNEFIKKDDKKALMNEILDRKLKNILGILRLNMNKLR